jgi:aryl-alcohol dehydrogenase-like predicted oxidoreductase
MALKGYGWLKKELTEDKIKTVRKLKSVADDLGCSMAQMAIAWCLKNPHVSTVITGASRVEQVHQNMKAMEIVPSLTKEVMDRIDQILGNKPKID